MTNTNDLTIKLQLAETREKQATEMCTWLTAENQRLRDALELSKHLNSDIDEVLADAEDDCASLVISPPYGAQPGNHPQDTTMTLTAEVPRPHEDGIRYPRIRVKLTGTDGNAFALLGKVRRALVMGAVPHMEVQAFMKEAMSGDYDHLLQSCMRWVDVR